MAQAETPTGKFLFGRQTKVLRRCPGGDDQRVTGVNPAIAFENERPFLQTGDIDVIENDFCLETPRVFFETLHQYRTLHAGRIGGPVVDVGGGHQLPPLRHAGDQHRFEVGTRRINGGGIAGGTGTEDQQAAVARVIRHFG